MPEKFKTYNNSELACEEAIKMTEKIKSGEAKNYNEAEKTVETEKEELIRKISKTALRSAERGRRSFFDKMTAENAGEMANLMEEKPIFYENKENIPQQILLDAEISDLFPEEFFKNPTQWIESQKNIERFDLDILKSFPSGRTINEVWNKPYDISKVKEFSLGNGENKLEIVSKRLDSKQLEEIVLARRAWEVGIPTPRVLGEIMDRGNSYAFFEKISAINIFTLSQLAQDEFVSHFSYSYEYDKESFFNMINQGQTAKILPDDAKKRLFLAWEKEREDIRLNAILLRIDGFFQQCISSSISNKFGYVLNDEINFKTKAKKDLLKKMQRLSIHDEISDNEIKKAISFLGFEEMDELINFIWEKYLPKDKSGDDYGKKLNEFKEKEQYKFFVLHDKMEKIDNEAKKQNDIS